MSMSTTPSPETPGFCTFCELLVPAIAQSGEETPVVEYNLGEYDSRLVNLGELSTCNLHSKVHDLYQIWCQGKTASSVSGFFPVTTCQTHLQACVDNENSHLFHGKYRSIVNPDPLGKSNIARIRRWIDTCNKNHDKCQMKELPLLPTRLIDVGVEEDAQSVHLVETRGERGKYIALSHCWGESHSLLTTRDTLEDMKFGFHPEKAPKTFCDAITVTRKLGIRYLWIDSLCIIQGDASDWEIESSKMGSVYRDAYLVLAASNASSDDEGFIKMRPPPIVCLKVYSPIGSNSLKIYLRRVAAGNYISSFPPQNEPLESRAWTLQESYLSRRQLRFCEHTVQWLCDSDAKDERDETHEGHNSHSLMKIFPDIKHGSLQSHEGWYNMVEDYSKRKLSFHTDRLPALSGLAAQVASYTQDRYLAGIWEKDALCGICWSRGLHILTRPDCYIAPSWSWVSVLGEVAFPSVKLSRLSFNPFKLASVKNCRIWHRGDNKFGIVDGGWINIKAPLVAFAKMRQKLTDISINDLERLDNRKKYYIFYINFDFMEEASRYSVNNYGLLVLLREHPARREDGTNATLYGIIVQVVEDMESEIHQKVALEAKNDQIYKRVGYFQIMQPTRDTLELLENSFQEIVLV